MNLDILNLLLELLAGLQKLRKIKASNSFISINTCRIDSHSHILCNNEVFKSQSALLKMYH